jgi:hypothetical protein
MIAYLLASLPTPRLGDVPDVRVDAVLERCAGFVGEERARDLAWVLGIRPADGRADVADDTQTTRSRPASLGRPRPIRRRWPGPSSRTWSTTPSCSSAARGPRSIPQPYLRRPAGFRVDVSEGVAAAFELPHPGVRERALDELRWRLADELRVGDPDGFGALVARAVHLRLAWRRAGWNEEDGWLVLKDAQRRIEERHG